MKNYPTCILDFIGDKDGINQLEQIFEIQDTCLIHMQSKKIHNVVLMSKFIQHLS